MTSPHWRFARMNESAPNENPVQGEFFISTADLADRFVRESIQNSLDAAANLDSQPVQMRFAFNTGSRELPPEKAEHYIRGLEPHLEAALESPDFESSENRKDHSLPYARGSFKIMKSLLSEPMSSLVVEDFGTTGLTGSIYSNSPQEKNNDFWGFFRSVGISPKSKDAGGSWGLGKWVFSDVSTINSVIGVTLRQGEPHPLVMGQSVLKTHIITESDENVKYPSYGSFATHSEDSDSTWLPMPVGAPRETDQPKDLEFIETTISDFNLKRADYSGLSVIIPFPKYELTADSIAQAVVINYFLPIIREQLVVVIDDSESDTRKIDHQSIMEEVSKIIEPDYKEISAESLSKAIKLAQWSQTEENKRIFYIDVPEKGGKVFQKRELEEVRKRYDDGEPIAFSIAMEIARQSNRKNKIEADFKLFIEKDDSLLNGQDYYVRGHLHIPDIDTIKQYKARSLVIVEGASELGHLLRDSEGPAHRNWNPLSKNLSETWVSGANKVGDVRLSAGRILKVLTKHSSPTLENVLADLFPAKIPNRNGNRPPPLPTLPIQASPIYNGFKVSNRVSTNMEQESLELIGTKWRLTFAYDLERGTKAKAFKRFEDSIINGYPDFSLYTEQLDTKDYENCTISVIAENKLEFEILSIPFYLSVTGFDTRDVITEIVKMATSRE